MIVKMAMLMAISVGTMIRMRWTMYPALAEHPGEHPGPVPHVAYPRSFSTAVPIGERARRSLPRRQLRRSTGLVEPESVRLVDAKVRARVPVVDTVGRDVRQPVVDHHRLQHAGDEADRKHLLGPDIEHLMPNLRSEER